MTTPISDGELREAVVAQHSWRGVLRALGLPAGSSRNARLLRDRALALGIDVTHFRGQRSWSDAALLSAVPAAGNWAELMQNLGYPGESGSARNTIRGHCARLGISVAHLDGDNGSDLLLPQPSPAAARLRDAGPLLVAAFLTLEGYRVPWPLEPAPCDLLVTQAKQTPSRVQVKTSVRRDAGSWVCSLTRHSYSAERDGTSDRFTTSEKSTRSASWTGSSRST